MQIGGKGLENLLMNMVLEKKKLRNEKTSFYACLLGNMINTF
jgi:hypothetical protein